MWSAWLAYHLCAGSMEVWSRGLAQHRPAVWGGIGTALCLAGAKFRYSALFFPFLRVSDARDADTLLDHAYRAFSVLATPPRDLHPVLWRSVQALALEVTVRAVNLPVLLEVLFGGAAACAALWLDEAPASFVAVGGLYPRLRAARASSMLGLRRYTAAVAHMPLTLLRTSPQTGRTVTLVAEQLALSAVAWVFVKFDWAIAVVANAVLGTELLLRAGREVCPKVVGCKAVFLLWDSVCISFGMWGLARQLRSSARRSTFWSRSADRLRSYGVPLAAESLDCCCLSRRGLDTLDRFLLL